MINKWTLRFILDTSIINSQQKEFVEWSSEGFEEQYRFISKINTIFQGVFSRSLPKQLKGAVEFKTSSIVTLDDKNQYIMKLNIASNDDLGLYNDAFSMLADEFELAIRAIQDAIEKIILADPMHPEKIHLTQHKSQLLNQVQISHPLCRDLIEKIRLVRDKKIFPITIMLPDSSQLTFDISSIAKSSEDNANPSDIITGRIVEYSDKEQRFFLLPKRSKSQLVFIPSIPDKIREQLLTLYLNKAYFEISVKPTIEYIGGERKYKAFQFEMIVTPDPQLNFN